MPGLFIHPEPAKNRRAGAELQVAVFEFSFRALIGRYLVSEYEFANDVGILAFDTRKNLWCVLFDRFRARDPSRALLSPL